MSIFVKKTSTFTVKIKVGTDPNDENKIFATGADNKDVISSWAKNLNVSEYQIVFRFPNYKDSTEIVDECVSLIDGKFNIKSSQIRYSRINKLIKSWNLTENGEEIKITPEAINSIHPIVAAAIGEELEKVIGVI